MRASWTPTVDPDLQIDPPEREPTLEDEEQAAWEWFFDVAFPHLAPPDPSADEPYWSRLGLEEDFEALCDAAQETANY